MKRIAMFILIVLMGGVLFAVYAKSPGEGAGGESSMHEPAAKSKGMMMGGARDMSRRMEMMRKAGVSDDQIRQWKTISMAPIYLDSPEALLGQADMLGLTADQKQQLQDIRNQSREKARAILTEDQKNQLGKVPDQPMTMMDIHRQVMAKMMPMRHRMMMREGGMDRKMDCPNCPMCPMKQPGARNEKNGSIQTTQPADQQ